MGREPEILGRKTVFEGRKVALEVRRLRGSDGREAQREIVRHPGSVAILAFPEPGLVLLERNWREAIGREMLEIPAGTLEPGEDPVVCAARELVEETGYQAMCLEPILTLHPSPGILTEQMTVYLAADLTAGEPSREAGEEIANVLAPVDEALAMIADGRITDAKTVAALLFWRRYRQPRKAGGA
jgi:ADP-ribose pyrophosphatase